MILISDLLHGFIDGITIGAIAMLSVSDCLRMTVPIVCEEFSHKLGKLNKKQFHVTVFLVESI